MQLQEEWLPQQALFPLCTFLIAEPLVKAEVDEVND